MRDMRARRFSKPCRQIRDELARRRLTHVVGGIFTSSVFGGKNSSVKNGLLPLYCVILSASLMVEISVKERQ